MPTTKNYSVARLGSFAELQQHTFTHPRKPDMKVRGKVFMKEALGLTGLEVSLTKFKPGFALPFLHKHRKNEELYICLAGVGEIIVDGEVTRMEQGTAVRVAPDGARSIRNVSGDDFVFICIQGAEGSMPDASTGTDGMGVEGAVPWPA